MNPGAEPAILLGVVLCGGESRRMGKDKGLIGQEGVPWAARMGRKLLPWGLPVVYSIRAAQEAAYGAALPGEVLVRDEAEIGGPMNGLFTVHRRYPNSDLLLLSCDLQDLDEETIGNLIAEYRKGGAEFYVYFDGEFAQPFCAVYRAVGLARLDEEMGGERRLRAMIAKGKLKRLEIGRAEAFTNHNSG